eukprot:evm.model.scf_335EXC.6 EVM.evm.TU.scf_335EXC.6   scf_335EXC:34980-35348(-)
MQFRSSFQNASAIGQNCSSVTSIGGLVIVPLSEIRFPASLSPPHLADATAMGSPVGNFQRHSRAAEGMGNIVCALIEIYSCLQLCLSVVALIGITRMLSLSAWTTAPYANVCGHFHGWAYCE